MFKKSIEIARKQSSRLLSVLVSLSAIEQVEQNKRVQATSCKLFEGFACLLAYDTFKPELNTTKSNQYTHTHAHTHCIALTQTCIHACTRAPLSLSFPRSLSACSRSAGAVWYATE